ncbi:MAG: ABC transporter substrate-binding protein [Microlunatus sp.]
MGRVRKFLTAVSLAATAFALAACGNAGDPLSPDSASPSPPVVVGSANVTESRVLGELYAQAIGAKGVPVETKPGLASREASITALKEGAVSVVPEYTGGLLLALDPAAPATTESEIMQVLPTAIGAELKVLEPSPAQNQFVYVVTKQTSQQLGITSLDGLEKVPPTAILGGPAQLKDQAYGLPGLQKIYGAKFTRFTPYDALALKVADLNANKIQLAALSTTDAAIRDNGYVMLTDPQSMILPQNVIPLVRADVAANTAAVDAINAVQQALTTDDLAALNKQVDSGHEDPHEVAATWLKAKGLV